MTGPMNPPAMMLRMTMLPAFRGSLVAPMTATDLGFEEIFEIDNAHVAPWACRFRNRIACFTVIRQQQNGLRRFLNTDRIRGAFPDRRPARRWSACTPPPRDDHQYPDTRQTMPRDNTCEFCIKNHFGYKVS